MKIKFNPDGKLLLNKAIEIPNMAIIARAVFHKNSRYYPHVFLGKSLYKM